MTSFSYKALAEGQLPVAKGTLYTCPTGLTAAIKLITLVNTDVADRTVNLYVKTGSTSRRIIPQNLSLVIGNLLEAGEEGYTLEAGDLIEGDASAATVVDYTINGAESA